MGSIILGGFFGRVHVRQSRPEGHSNGRRGGSLARRPSLVKS
jgi:hypothetical protein